MKVFVVYEGQSERPFVFDHDPALPLKDFKARVRRRFEGTRNPIILFHNGMDIIGEDDDCTLDQCGIHDGTTLFLGYRVPFIIRFHCGVFEYMIVVSCCDTIHSLKQKIERRTKIPEEEQELEYNEVTLSESERTLLSHGIYKVKRGEFICDFTVHLADTTNQYFADIDAEIKKGFSDAQLNGISVSAAKIQVHVKTGYSSEPLTLNLDPTLHLSTLKHALQDKYGSRSDQLLLFLNGKNLFEEENSTLEQCGIESGATLLLGYTGCFLVKFWCGDCYDLVEIDCSDTVGRIQQAITKATGIPTYDQALSCSGVNMFDPGRTLFSHGIFRTKIGTDIFVVTIDRQGYFEEDQPKRIFHHSWRDFNAEAIRRGVPVGQVIKERNARLCIIIPLKDDPSAVNIVFDIPALKGEFSYRFMPNETVENVKSAIRQKRHKKFIALKKNVSFLSNGEFELEFQGQILNNNSKTLDSLGIKSGSIVQLYDSKSFGATVLELDNKVRCILDVHCWLTIRALKERVYNETQVSPDKQLFYYEHQCLDRDELRLVDYHLLNLIDLTKRGRVTIRLVTSNATSLFKEDARCLKQRRVEIDFQLHN